MTDQVAKGTLRLLVVEGRGDEYFFTKWLEFLGWRDQIEFINCEGKDNLVRELTNTLNRDDFPKITDIGIIVDNDYPENRNGANAFETVIEAIDDANANLTVNNPEISRELAKPTAPRVKTPERPRISVLLLPSDDGDGAIEDLVFAALPEDSVLACVDSYFACLRDAGITANQARLPKNKLSVYLSGIVTDEDYARHDDAKRLFLTNAIEMKWWEEQDMWNKCAFDDAKAFLAQLLTD